jgi:hypothetical protein
MGVVDVAHSGAARRGSGNEMLPFRRSTMSIRIVCSSAEDDVNKLEGLSCHSHRRATTCPARERGDKVDAGLGRTPGRSPRACDEQIIQ